MLAIEQQNLLPSLNSKCIIFPQSPRYPMLKEKEREEKKKVNDPCSAIAVYAWVTQKPGWAGFLVGLVFLHNHANSTFVLRTVLLEEVVGLGLCRWLGVWVIQEILDAKQELLNSDGRSPTLFLIQNWQANRSGRVDIRVEKCRREFAWTVLVLVLCWHERS